MTLEANQVKTSAEAAVSKSSDKPNFSEVYSLLSNNTTAQEQKQERTAFDEALHTKFPDLDLIGQSKLEKADGQQTNALVTFDRKSNQVQARNSEDFSIIEAKDISEKMKQTGLTAEKTSQILAASSDAGVEKLADLNKTGSQPSPKEGTTNNKAETNSSVKSDQSSQASSEKSTEKETAIEPKTDKPKENIYVVKDGDCLWTIAEAQLKGQNAENKEISNANIRSYVDQIVAKNRDQIKDEDLIYQDQKFVLPEIAAKEATTDIHKEEAEKEEAEKKETKTSDKETNDGSKVEGTDKPDSKSAIKSDKQQNPNIFEGKRSGEDGKDDKAPDKPAPGKEQTSVTDKPAAGNEQPSATDKSVPDGNPYGDMSKYFGLPGTAENPTVGYYNAEKQSKFAVANFATIDADKSNSLSVPEIEAFRNRTKTESGEKSAEYMLSSELVKNATVIANTVSDAHADSKDGTASEISQEDLKRYSYTQSRYENQFAARQYASENFDAIAAASDDPDKDKISESDVETYMDKRIAGGASKPELEILVGLKELLSNVDTDGTNNISKEDFDKRLTDSNIRFESIPYSQRQGEPVAVGDHTIQMQVAQRAALEAVRIFGSNQALAKEENKQSVTSEDSSAKAPPEDDY